MAASFIFDLRARSGNLIAKLDRRPAASPVHVPCVPLLFVTLTLSSRLSAFFARETEGMMNRKSGPFADGVCPAQFCFSTFAIRGSIRSHAATAFAVLFFSNACVPEGQNAKARSLGSSSAKIDCPPDRKRRTRRMRQTDG